MSVIAWYDRYRTRKLSTSSSVSLMGRNIPTFVSIQRPAVSTCRSKPARLRFDSLTRDSLLTLTNHNRQFCMHKWLPAFFLLCSLSGSTRTNNAIAITHVTVIDCTGAAARPNSTVVVTGGVISTVGPSGTGTIPAGARVVDANGKFLIPGLWDMHGHLTDATADAFLLLIMNGVTGVRDMGGDLRQIDRWRSEINNGTRVGPHIIRAGPFVDGPKEGVTNRLTVRTPEEARQAVRDLKAKGVDFIKVHNALPPDAFFALMDEARKEHIPVAVHLPKGVSSAEASDAGVASLEHIETVNESALWRKGATAKTVEQAVDENLGPAGRELFQRFAKNGTWYVPTLVAYERGFMLWSNDPEALKPRMDVQAKQITLVGMMQKAGVKNHGRLGFLRLGNGARSRSAQ